MRMGRRNGGGDSLEWEWLGLCGSGARSNGGRCAKNCTFVPQGMWLNADGRGNGGQTESENARC